jgi:hypothetical protein
MAPELSIDPATGALELAGVIRLAPWSGKRAARVALAPFIRAEQDMGTGYSWLYAAGFSFGGTRCWLDLCFLRGLFGSRLESAHFSVHLGELPAAPQWPSREEMDAEIVFMRTELQRQLGRSFDKDEEFPWGGAWCSYDPRSDTARSGVRYK